MKLLKIAVIGLLLISSISQSFAQAEGKAITVDVGFDYQFESKVLNEQRRYLISLPEDYSNSDSDSGSDKKYPVIYILDGDSHFQHATQALRYLEKFNRIPESILVGIPNASGSRFRDLAQKHDLFLKFIEDELIPLIDKNYKTQGLNTLFGHSLAGSFSLYAMSENHNKINNYIAASPHLLVNKGEIQATLKSLFSDNKLHDYNAYFSMADKKGDGAERFNEIEKFVSFLNNNATQKLSWKYQSIADQEHMTTPYLTIYQGLSFVFKDYQMPVFASFTDFEKQGGMKMLEVFYEKRGNKYDEDTKVDAVTVGLLAELLLDENQPDKAVELLKGFVAKNQNSMRAHFDIARLYQNTGDKELALKSYKSAQQLLKPKHKGFITFIASQIKELETED